MRKIRMSEPMTILLICALFLVVYSMVNAYAAPAKTDLGKIVVKSVGDSMKGKGIGLVLSNTCIAMAKANNTGLYPNYADLIQYDNSIQKYSGKFINSGGYVHRESVKHGFGIYSYDNTFRIFVDPPSTTKIPLITIACNSLQEYHTPSQFKVKLQNHSTEFERYYTKIRWVNPSCDYAVITGQDWQKVIPDTIEYLKSDCTKTNIETIVKVKTPATRHDYGTSSKAKLDNYYKEVKNVCTKQKSFYGKCGAINKAVTLDEDTK